MTYNLANTSSISDDSLRELAKFFLTHGGLGLGTLTDLVVTTATARVTRKVQASAYRRHHGHSFDIRLTVPSRNGMEGLWTPLTRIAHPDRDVLPPDACRAITQVMMRLVQETSSGVVVCGQSGYEGDVVELHYKAKTPSVERSADDRLVTVRTQMAKLGYRRAEITRQIAKYQQKLDDIDDKLKKLVTRERKLEEKRR